MEESRVLSVVVEGVEYRSLETREHKYDPRGEPYLEDPVRTGWFSREGGEISDELASEALRREKDRQAGIALLDKLWGDSA